MELLVLAPPSVALLGSLKNNPPFSVLARTPEFDSNEWTTRFCPYSDLGRTAALYDITDREGMTIFWISYWKDLKALQRFSASALHRAGMNAYGQKKHPYCGLMHETYHAPKGSWENLYGNMPPTGLGKYEH
jgi:hypothetical protein